MNDTAEILNESQLQQIVRSLAQEVGGKKAVPHGLNGPEAAMQAASIIETHISLILLTGPWAYKFKKPVNFGFLDFSTATLRKLFCDEEIRLNKRTAPQLYVDVVEVRGQFDAAHFGGTGPLLTHAVRMNRFDPEQTLDHVLARDELTKRHVDETVKAMADFHDQVTIAKSTDAWGEWASITRPVTKNFQMLREILPGTAIQELSLDELEQQVSSLGERLKPVFARRKQEGNIRECHGDLHLGNLALIDDRVTAFDGLEFNPGLRWIDTASDIAFLVMDLAEKGREDLSRRFLTLYLEHRGDWGALDVLPYYQCYRAMVRAKVAALRWNQTRTSTDHTGLEEVAAYVALAKQRLQSPKPSLTITCGLSGSGKSTVAMAWAVKTGALRLRSDVERMRLFPTKNGRYWPNATQQTYAYLCDLAARIISSGYPVVVDATFLNAQQRAPFLQLAENLGIQAGILKLDVPLDVLRARIRRRLSEGRDVSEASIEVMEQQNRETDPLSSKERSLILPSPIQEAESSR